MSNSIKDRSGMGLPPKAERRALGKAAAAQRAAQRRRKELLTRVTQIAAPFGLVLVVIAAVWFFAGGSGTPTGTTQAGASPSAQDTTAAAPSLPPDADPALATKPVVAAPTGTVTQLTVTPLITGTGAAVANGQTITVNYVGVSFTTGAEIDSSWSKNTTFSFPLGQGKVISGWDQGLLGVKVGSRVQLDIPSNLAYGDDASTGKPTGPLRFVVDVLSAQ